MEDILPQFEDWLHDTSRELDREEEELTKKAEQIKGCRNALEIAQNLFSENMCLQGDSTIPARAEIISAQEKKLEEELKLLNEQMDILRYKKHYYQELLNTHSQDLCNPATMHVQEPDITPEHKSTLRTNQRKKR